MASKSIVRKDVWVRIPPAAPSDQLEARPHCRVVPPEPTLCVDDRGLDRAYVYLLGLYLGDGVVSRGARDVWRLRITQDSRYPGLIRSCQAAIAEVTGRRPGVVSRIGCVDINCYWKHWPCLFPQVGPGPKHLRQIELEPWQWDLVEMYPRELIKGLASTRTAVGSRTAFGTVSGSGMSTPATSSRTAPLTSWGSSSTYAG
jgi:hypothetical protein